MWYAYGSLPHNIALNKTLHAYCVLFAALVYHSEINGYYIKGTYWSLGITFQSSVESALTLNGKITQPKKGQLSITALPKKKQKFHVSASPISDVCYDNARYLQDLDETQQRCPYCSKGYKHARCLKCHVPLSFMKGWNCFRNFHCKRWF